MRLKLSHDVYQALLGFHFEKGKSKEAMSFLFARKSNYEENAVFTVGDIEQIYLLDESCYELQTGTQLRISTELKSKIYWMALEAGYDAVIDVHDHWFANSANFSSTDDKDDIATALWFKNTVAGFETQGAGFCAFSMLLAKEELSAREVKWDDHEKPSFKEVIVDVLTETLLRFSKVDSDSHQLTWHKRHKTFLSDQSCNLISDLNFTIVGAGGLGSIALEGLIRMGARNINIIDADKIEEHNLNRLQGVGSSDVGRYKVEALKSHWDLLANKVNINAITQDVFSEQSIRALSNADIILGCVDNGETRWWLNRFAVQYMVPFFDAGVVISNEQAPLMKSRVNIVIPGYTSCGHCSVVQFYKLKTPDKFLDLLTLKAQRSEGYIEHQANDVPAPSAYALNQQAISNLTLELMNWIAGWRPLSYSIVQTSDQNHIWRLNQEKNPVRPKEDCPICACMIGKSHSETLPTEGKEIELSAELFNHVKGSDDNENRGES